jgi:hypothetical protein
LLFKKTCSIHETRVFGQPVPGLLYGCRFIRISLDKSRIRFYARGDMSVSLAAATGVGNPDRARLMEATSFLHFRGEARKTRFNRILDRPANTRDILKRFFPEGFIHYNL